MSDSNTALITEANKGIGLEIARQLGKVGYSESIRICGVPATARCNRR